MIFEIIGDSYFSVPYRFYMKRKVRTAKDSVLPNGKALLARTASATERIPPSGKGEKVG